MAKTMIAARLKRETINDIKNLTLLTGKSQAVIIEESVSLYLTDFQFNKRKLLIEERDRLDKQILAMGLIV